MNLIFYPFHTWHIMFGSVPLIQSVVLFVINLFNHNPHRGYISYNSDNEINNLDMNYH